MAPFAHPFGAHFALPSDAPSDADYFEAIMSLWGILGGDILDNILPDWIFLLRRWKGGLFSLKNGVFKTQEIKTEPRELILLIML